MKKIFYLFLVIMFNYCTNNIEVETLKYSSKDLIPLNDSSKALYNDDAALIEYRQILKDPIKKYEQVELDENNIQSYYEDLLFIYNNSFKLSNSFFDYAKSLHSHGAGALYQILVSVDTSKSWLNNWKNGIKHTGIIEIDTIIDNYNLDINFNFKFDDHCWFEIKSGKPINDISLMYKFEETHEFQVIEPVVLIGEGSSISLYAEDNYRRYRYDYGWGDCPSGCISHHYWIIKLKDSEIGLVEEGGDHL